MNAWGGLVRAKLSACLTEALSCTEALAAAAGTDTLRPGVLRSSCGPRACPFACPLGE